MRLSKVTAVHEAGHVVVAVSLRRRVFDVTIVPSESLGGSVDVEGGGSAKKERDIDAVVDFAGVTAEKVLLGRWYLDGGADDFDSASELIRKNVRRLHRIRRVSEKRLVDYSKSLWGSAFSIIRKNEWAVQTIAEVLLSNGSLSEDDIGNFICLEESAK